MNPLENLDDLKLAVGNTIAHATFTKKDGSERRMSFRLHVTKGVKGTGDASYRAVFNQIAVYDLAIGAWRTLSLPLKRLVARGVVYEEAGSMAIRNHTHDTSTPSQKG